MSILARFLAKEYGINLCEDDKLCNAKFGNPKPNKCLNCLANYTGEHTCDPLMKELVKRKKGIVKEAKKFSKEITLIRCHAIIMKDEHGQVIYTFDSKKKADEFYEELNKTNETI